MRSKIDVGVPRRSENCNSGNTENTRKEGVSVAATGFSMPTGKTVNFAKEGIWCQHKKAPPPQEGH